MKRNNDFLVGSVILITIVVLIGAVLWVRESDVGQRRTRVVARFSDGGNARVGNAVVVRGVRAGRVESMELAPGGWVHVRLTIDPQVRLPSDPVVLLNESSLFGDWRATVMERSALPREEAVLAQIQAADGAGGGLLPGATLPDIAKLTAVAASIAGDVQSVAQRFEVAFDERAATELRGSIRSVAELSATLARTVREHAGDLDTLSRGLQDAVRSMNQTAATARAMADRLDVTLQRDQMQRIVTDVGYSAAELRKAADQINVLSGRLSASQARLDAILVTGDSVFRKINDGQGSLGLLVNDASFYRNSDSLVIELRDLVQDVKRNPRRYFTLRLFR